MSLFVFLIGLHIYTSNENIREIIYRLSEDRRFDIVLYGEELAKRHLKNPRSGDIVVVASKGYELGSKKLKGSHVEIDSAEFFIPLIVK